METIKFMSGVLTVLIMTILPNIILLLHVYTRINGFNKSINLPNINDEVKKLLEKNFIYFISYYGFIISFGLMISIYLYEIIYNIIILSTYS